MHAIKGSWVGQTFALAKYNDGGGKKSRIRRSKEERKDMVESFIKKYQESNNGSFPSLNLTHKEVGGSFYTVREIVREVIQENRVLGPAKLTPEEQSSDRFFEEYPLGLIATQPKDHIFLSNESHVTHILPNIHDVINEELVSNSSGLCPGTENKRVDNGNSINGSTQAVEKEKECDAVIEMASLGRDSLDVEKNIVELGKSKAEVTHILAEVVVETFPLRPVSGITYGVDEKSSETRELIGSSEEKEIEKVKVEVGNQNSVLDVMNLQESSSVLVVEKADAPLGSSLEKNRELVGDRSLKFPNGSATKAGVVLGVSIGGSSLESSNGSTTHQGTMLDDKTGSDLEVNNVSPAEIKAIIAPNGIKETNLSSSCGQAISDETVATKHNPEIKHGGNLSQEASNPTLDRINLESWERRSGKPAGPEMNPFLALVKGFIAALVKFWTE